MAKKNLEELAKDLGYKNFDKMKESVGNKDSGFSFGSLFGGKKNKETSPSKAGNESESTGGISADVLPFLNVIAKNSIVLPGMARDMNVLRQNISKLVNLKGKESKVKAEGKADKFFQTEEAREAKLEEERKLR